MAFGVMGGNIQPQGHAQMVMPKVVEQFNPQACSDAPRWRIDNAAALMLEPTVALEIAAGLQAAGHMRCTMPAENVDCGDAQLIERLETADGRAVYVASIDHRLDGQVVAY